MVVGPALARAGEAAKSHPGEHYVRIICRYGAAGAGSDGDGAELLGDQLGEAFGDLFLG